jgi:WD40 repeat protein/DNA-binding SARP family transcriptional activator
MLRWLQPLDFRLLGPLEVVDDGGLALPVGAGRQRALLALLLLRANELVASDRLVDELWGESPPSTAHKMLHNQVSGLRQALGRNGRLETHGSAYRLNVSPGERDVDRFEELLASGRTQIEADPAVAAEKLRQALDLWRGPPLSDLPYERFAQTEIARLEERRWAAFEARTEAELALGRHADLISELEAALAEQPLREHLHGQLMLALYRCGRQAEALEAYRRARRTLVEEIGVEPGPELRALHEAILAQDPALDAPPEELPAALDGGSPLLAGRDRELAELLALLANACEGRGGMVLISGPRGIGKTRLAAELARDALRRRMAVVYTGAGSPSAEALGAIRRAEKSERPVLLVVDDADDAGAELLDRAAEVGGDSRRRRLLLLVLHERREPPAVFAAQAGRFLELGPLEDDAIAEIARLYLPAGVEPLPPQALAEESRGVPLAVHAAAAEWARARASRVAGASAARAAVERGELRAAEADFSGDLLALGTVEERGRLYRSEGDGAPLPAVCPFLGLATFDAAHAEYFFGRERLVAELVARLVGSPLLAVVGPSGSGKSSAVRAGLLPALASGVLPGSEGWSQALMRPGEHPMAELERVLPRPDERAVLVVDQFEEVFTVCRDERERTDFLDSLVALAEDHDRRVQVVVAMRADFYGHCATHDRLARLVGANQVLVGPMRRDELRRAIVEPARKVGLRVEPSLTDVLIVDVLDEPGGLPLLSAALLEQWSERDGHVMRRAAYERTGGVRGAVGRLAEATYARLSEPERIAAKRILLRLADAGQEEASFVRRRVPLQELDPERDTQTAAALGLLVDSRLVTADEGSVEVAHEALLREWPRLRAWLEEDAEGRRLHQHLIHAAQDWEAADRDPGELYRGARLASALDWAGDHHGDLNELEREFLDASRAEAEHDAEHQRRTNRRLRALLAGLAALLALALVAGVVALNQRGEARDAARVADAQRLGAQALTVDELDRALLLARTGVALEDSVATRGNLLAALLRVPPGSLGVLPDVRDNAIYGIALSPRGDRIAIGDHVGEVRLFDARTRRELGSYRLKLGLVQRLAFSPDGATLAVAGQEPETKPPGALIDLLDARTLERRQRIVLPPPPGGGFAGASPVFTADGRGLTVVQNPLSKPGPQSVYRVDLDAGVIAGRPFRSPGGALDPAYSSDRRRLFVPNAEEDVTYELDTADLRVIARHPAGGSAVALHPGEDLLAVGAADGSMRFVELPSRRVHRLAGKHDGEVSAMKFSGDGRSLVSGDSNGGLIAWDVERRVLRERLEGHAAEVSTLVITPDGRTAITAGQNDGKVAFWDLDDSRRLVRGVPLASRFVADESTPRGVALSPDDRTLAVTHENGTVELLDTSTLEPRGVLEAFDEIALATDFSPDGRLLAVAGDKGELGLWDARTLASVRRLKGLRGWTQAVAFAPDGRLVAAGDYSDDSRVLIWDVGSGRRTGFEIDFAPAQLTFSPDGRLLAAAGRESGVEVRDVASGRLAGKPPLDEMARAVAFSPDGKLLFVGQYNGTGMFFSTENWKPAGPGIRGHGQRILNARFTPDGRTLATSSADGTVQLWDVASRRSIGAPLVVQRNLTFVATILSRDGSYLYALPTGTEGMRLALTPRLWRDLACAIAGRELTRREWDEVLPDRPYREVCAPA